MRAPLWLFLALAWALTPSWANADPVSAFIVGALGLVGTAATVATFVINTLLMVGINAVVSKVIGPKGPKSSGQERQASIMQLSLGEGPREAIFGRSATGGTLLDAYNHGGTNKTDWEVIVIKVADHQCDALEGFFIGDTFYAYAADGAQTGFNGQLEIYWMDGAADQLANAYLLSTSAGRLYGLPWEAVDVCRSMAVFIAAYKADAPNAATPVWPQGRPSFKPVVRGKKCYDPRKDSTISGGSGAHRWDDPSTWEWSENAAICDYNYDRGVYALDDVGEPNRLLIGRGLTAEEAPPERVAARANVCDEDVALKAGGTEKRYRCGGVIFANESFIDVKQKFADAMGGDIVKRNGGVEVLPGAAQSVVAEITDRDLVVGEAVTYEPFLSDNDRINIVAPRYVEPTQVWRSHGCPIRRSTEDVIDDGGPKVADPSYDLVTSQSQAQRIGEIRRRKGRREGRGGIVLTPPYADLEDGDWIGWTSQRYFNGGRVVFQLSAAAVQQSYRTVVGLQEISADCYAWNPATDEGTPGEAPVDEAGSVGPVELDDVDIFAWPKVGAGGNLIPGIRATWDTPVDLGIIRIRAEVREVGSLTVAVTVTDDVNAGSLDITNGVGPAQDLEARLIPLGVPGREYIPSDWFSITSDDMARAGFQAQLWTIPLNLWGPPRYLMLGGSVKVDPFTAFGVSGQAITIDASTSGDKIEVVDVVYQDPVYSFSNWLAVNTGTQQLHMGFRSTIDGLPLDDLPDKVFNITTTPTRLTWDNIVSADPDFFTLTNPTPGATPRGTSDVELKWWIESGDEVPGQLVYMTDFMFLLVPLPPEVWRPNPNAKPLSRWQSLINTLFDQERARSPLQTLRVNIDGGAYEYGPPGPTRIVEVA